MSFEAQFGVYYYYIINIINIIIVELSINLNEQRSFLLHEKKNHQINSIYGINYKIL